METNTTDDWKSPDTDALFDAMLTLDSRDEAERFFRDLCTRNEIDELSARWAVVRLLDEGLSYRTIAGRTGVSTATITRISEWLRHGTGGYRLVLDRTKIA
jgi:TrpR-related protein YerC/YecD